MLFITSTLSISPSFPLCPAPSLCPLHVPQSKIWAQSLYISGPQIMKVGPLSAAGLQPGSVPVTSSFGKASRLIGDTVPLLYRQKYNYFYMRSHFSILHQWKWLCMVSCHAMKAHQILLKNWVILYFYNNPNNFIQFFCIFFLLES